MEKSPAAKNVGGQVLPAGAGPLRPDDPTAIGGHRLAGRLTSGRTRVVYLARDGRGDLVAVKTSRTDAAQAEVRRRLRREAACIQRLPAACTARLLADGSREAPPYLVSEYVDGPALRDLVEERGPLGAGPVRALAAALARALVAVHDARIAHCDVRPGNVLLAADGPRLMDFGAAEEIGAPDDPLAPVTDDPRRPPPSGSGPARDVFGWGCLVAYAATGQRMFADADLDVPTAFAVAGELDDVPEPIRGLVEAALAEDPAGRPTARDLFAAVEGGGRAPRPLPARGAPRRVRPAVPAGPSPIPSAADASANPAAAPRRPVAGSPGPRDAPGGGARGLLAERPVAESFRPPADAGAGSPGGTAERPAEFRRPHAGRGRAPATDSADGARTEAFERPDMTSIGPVAGSGADPGSFTGPPARGSAEPAGTTAGTPSASAGWDDRTASDGAATEVFASPAVTSPDAGAARESGRPAGAFAGPATSSDGPAVTSPESAAGAAGAPETDGAGHRDPRSAGRPHAGHAATARPGHGLPGTAGHGGPVASGHAGPVPSGHGGPVASGHGAMAFFDDGAGPAARTASSGPDVTPPRGSGAAPGNGPARRPRRGRALVAVSALVLLTGACAAVVVTTGGGPVRPAGPADTGTGVSQPSRHHGADRSTVLRRRGAADASATPEPSADPSGAARAASDGGSTARRRTGGSKPGGGSSRPGSPGPSKPVTSPSPTPSKTPTPSPTPTPSTPAT